MKIPILDTQVDIVGYSGVTQKILKWILENETPFICVANVHMLMEAYDSPEFLKIVNDADLVVPDGVPLVWMMRLKGVRDQQRVYGPTLMLHILETALREDNPVGFYGGEPETLDLLEQRMKSRYDGLKIAFSMSPPFRELRLEEDEEIVYSINRSGIKILFVGLGCPKQEIWMANHRGKVNAVMVGVGAAFDFHAGVKPQAPKLLQSLGLEWFFRLVTEPRRLWRRYLYHNPRFILLAIADLMRSARI